MKINAKFFILGLMQIGASIGIIILGDSQSFFIFFGSTGVVGGICLLFFPVDNEEVGA